MRLFTIPVTILRNILIFQQFQKIVSELVRNEELCKKVQSCYNFVQSLLFSLINECN